MLKFSCPSCQKGIAGKPELAGKTVPCPHCKTPILVPGQPAPAPTQAPQQPLPGAGQQMPQQQQFPQQPGPQQPVPGQMMPQQPTPMMPQQSAPMQQPFPQNPAPMQMPGQPFPMGAAPVGADPLFGGGDPLGDPLGDAMSMEQMGGQMPGGVPIQQPGMPGQPAFPAFGQPGGVAARGRKRSSKGLIIAISASVGGVVLLTVVGLLVYSLMGGGSPSSAFLSLVGNFKSQNWGRVWDGLDSATHEQASAFLSIAAMSPNPVTSGLNLSGKSDRQKFVAILDKVVSEKATEFKRDVASASFEVVSEEINGDQATLEIREVGRTRTNKITMVKEGGRWKLSFAGGLPGGFGPSMPTPTF